MKQARSAWLLTGEPSEIAEQFAGLLWGCLMVRLMLRVVDQPSPRQMVQRAHKATVAFLRLYAQTDAGR
ncbi:TetR/AcrR family transcriptional regulator C-terminal domain-containing protein [Mesorhizobium tianshanense]|uniref:AefR-like transcriptional repressor n=1 Tax=Mesorhizobium tianshanense TaxID=39844 RepID=A0A562P2P0_9HYPH|nr:AefR-like transcriptional repressor [Mesorhizobium tianshanense]